MTEHLAKEEEERGPDSLKSHELTKRVLYHLVHSYQSFREIRGFMPNELTDDAVRIGEQHLRDVDWFPPDEGWLANNTDTSPTDGKKNPDPVLDLIDDELRRLREPVKTQNFYYTGRRRKGWVDGLTAAREVAADQLQIIRNAYVVESLTREAERLGLYDIDTNGFESS